MALTGAQAEQLSGALRDAFRERDQLDRMLWFKCNKQLSDIAGTGGLEQVVADVIKDAERRGWTEKLVEGAIADNSRNVELRQFYESTWLALSLPPGPKLESLVSPGGLFDLDPWIARVVDIGRRICRITVFSNPGPTYGTGFLVAPDLVLTNYHVMKPVVLGERGGAGAKDPTAKTANVELRFDYKTLRDKTGINDGTVYRLKGSSVDDWLLADSPPSPFDDHPVVGQEPGPDELDFALVRLDGSPGDDTIGGDSSHAPRGWIDFPAPPTPVTAGSGLLIAQHPSGHPIKLDLRDQAVLAVNGRGTRVTYVNNTLGGSSGSPCFLLDQDLPLVALHHLGDPNFPPAKQNQGIPISAISTWLEARGHKNLLGAHE